MKQLLIALFIFFTARAAAQDINVNQVVYTIIDTLRYKDMKAPVRRSNEGELTRYMASGGKNFDVARPLQVLEDGLENARAYLQKTNKKIAWLPNMREQLVKIKRAMPKFKVAEYEEELKIYEAYNKQMETRRQNQYANIDSVREAKELAAQRKKAEEEAKVNKKIIAKQRYDDSMRKIYFAQMAAAVAKEARANQEDYVKKYGKIYGPLIADGKVAPGMTKDMCRAALGEPKSKTTTEGDGNEAWEYGLYQLKFKNGELEEVENKK